jgi:predicted transcriptional regulator of viral defense system
LPFFDLAMVVQTSGEPKRQLLVQLHRWVKAGKVVALRRGLYTLAAPYCRIFLSPLLLANELYKPSYLSSVWTLSFYGLIPDKVTVFSSVTSRVTRSFRNPFGIFSYASVKRDVFWGFRSREIQGSLIWIAEPEKALLDFWHLNHGEWTADRMREMRFQHFDMVDMDRLTEYAGRWGMPRLSRAVSCYKSLVEAENDETLVL